MVARRLVTQTHLNNTDNIIQMHTDYVHSTKTPLPQGNWLISIIKGDAWIFNDGNNTVLHAGDKMWVDNENGQSLIRSLYVRGFSRYTLVSLD